MDIGPFLPVILAVLTTSTALFGFLWQRQTERLKIVEQQISLSKYQAYGSLVAIFYDMLKDIKAKKETNNTDLMNRLMNSKKDLFIYGSDKVFKKFVVWLTYTSTNPNDNGHLKLFLQMLIEIRKDMGNKNTKLTPRDIMLSLMQNEKEYEQIKPFIDW